MDLLRNVLQVICDQANNNLNNIEHRPDSWVELTSMVDHDGSLNQATKSKIVMGVYNITREAFSSSYTPVHPSKSGAGTSEGMAIVAPPLYLNVHLVFMANFTEQRYSDGLAALSRLIGFFQQMRVFTPQNSPALDPEIDKLTLDIENLSPADVNHVMSMLGTRYLPCAFYKLRMIPFSSPATMIDQSPPIVR